MFDSYEHTLTRQGKFVAGYKHCDVTRDSMGTYLFTTLRLLRVLRGSADWKIGKRVFRLREGDIIAVNNAEVRQVRPCRPKPRLFVRDIRVPADDIRQRIRVPAAVL